MDQELGVQAGDLVNALSRGELSKLFFTFGEERFSQRIADAIIRARQSGPIQTTTELASIVSRVVPNKQEKINPATRVFQALRIAVNDELNSLKEALPKALALLETGGRLVIISFHSLEDRIVKETFKEFKDKGLGTIITKKPIVPSIEEIAQNSRSRSSKLRVFEKL
ncbi:MAG TPA: 16S rRNA (cytosine(1402)-N(4))-methyltransferase RsmH, partial [Patescibacteria group bacterium]